MNNDTIQYEQNFEEDHHSHTVIEEPGHLNHSSEESDHLRTVREEPVIPDAFCFTPTKPARKNRKTGNLLLYN